MVSVASIVGETFRFVAARPRAIAAWAAANFAFTLAGQIVIEPAMAAQLAAMQAGIAPPASSALSLYWLASAAIAIILSAAVFRAVLRPEDDRFAYLRAGADELVLFATLLILAIGFTIAMVALMIGFGILGAILFTTAGAATPASAGLFAALLALGYFGALIAFAVRISPAGPMAVLERRIVIGAAWRLSKGRFWTLLGAYALIAVLLTLALALIVLLTMPGVWDIYSSVGRPDLPQRMLAWQVQFYAARGPVARALTAALGAVAGAVMLAFGAGVAAVATRQLLAERGTAA